MLEALNTLVAPAAMERLTLVLNHVLYSEPVATARLQPHAGRCIGLQLNGWPSLLPRPPVMAFRITPAGLLEWSGSDEPDLLPAVPDLHVSIDASNPAMLALRWAAGKPPAMDIQGDAALASDVNWLAENLRWDIAAELERIFGAAPAHELSKFAVFVKNALRQAARAGGDIASRLKPRTE